MKKLHLVLMVTSLLATVLFLSGSPLAQSSDALVVDDTGKVGIGTTSPSQPLHVLGNTRLDGRVSVSAPPTSTYQFKVQGTEVGVSGGNGYQRGLNVSVDPDPSKWTESYNLATGITAAVLSDASLGEGKTLNTLTGETIQYGAYTGTVGTVSLGRGLHITPYIRGGTVGDMYDIYLDLPGTGGTLTGKHYGIYQAHTGDNYLAGKVGIGTNSPAQKLHVDGNVIADDYFTPSAYYSGDALKVIQGMKPRTTESSDGWGKIDHSSAKETAVIYEYQSPVWGTKTVGQCMDELTGGGSVCEDVEERYVAGQKTETFEGISVDKSIAVLIRANQQLIKTNQELIARIEALEAKVK